MRNTFSLKSRAIVAVIALVAVGSMALFGVKPALADNGGIVINVKQELGTNLAGATVAIQCAGGTYTTLGVTDGSGNATALQAAVPAGANCNNTENVDVRVTLDGYVTKTVTAIGAYATGSQNTFNVTNVLFTYRMELVTNELGGDIMPTSGTPWTASGGTLVMATQVYSAGKWYLALSGSGGNLAFDLDGYVRANLTPTPSASAQTLDSNFFDILFAHKVVIKDELGNALTPTTVTAGTANTPCTVSGAAAYCPVVVANDNTLASGFVIAKDGYVTSSAAAVPLDVNRTANSEDQGITTMTTSNGLDFAAKVTATNDVDDSALTGATVTVGDSLAVTCAESGSTGVYYCILPLAHTAVIAQISKAGFITGSVTYTDRTVATAAQQAVSLALNPVASGGGGGGGGSTNNNNDEEPTPVTPAPVTPTPTTPAPAAPVAAATAIHMISAEKNFILDPVTLRMNTGSAANPALEASMKTKYASMWTGLSGYSAAEMNAVTNFITYGTGTTRKIGSGERAAAVSAYKEAYGSMPKTASNWEDVLNIANGYWPFTVNKATEARAYVNFKAVYGRDANMKNSTDVNALKMMGYGVRSTKARDMKVEAAAALKFKATFGYAPTTARHWNITRAIAYSGVVK